MSSSFQTERSTEFEEKTSWSFVNILSFYLTNSDFTLLVMQSCTETISENVLQGCKYG